MGFHPKRYICHFSASNLFMFSIHFVKTNLFKRNIVLEKAKNKNFVMAKRASSENGAEAEVKKVKQNEEEDTDFSFRLVPRSGKPC
jgi:hypothetical protein